MLLQAKHDSVEVLITVTTATPAEAVAAQKKLKAAITDNVYPSRLTAAGVHQLPPSQIVVIPPTDSCSWCFSWLTDACCRVCLMHKR